MAPKDDPKEKKKGKDEHKPKEEPKAKPLSNEKKKQENDGGGCSTVAKALIYIIPIALYIPWAYRMFKGNACCPEIPKPPNTSHAHGRHHPKWFRKEKGAGGSCGEGGEPAENPCAMPKEDPCFEEKAPKERDDCVDKKKSRQCLNKCLDKCLSKEGGRGKKRKEKRRNDCDDDDED